ncbi:caspase family protein [Novosphingobium resinovorum]|uniref:caspase family protein n=1 Tax=Novosphingobium resinovorum TaxID=158500 RepID=UPI00138E32F7|nr:caspase family protein [Novosphingobium resinovorum]
MGIVPQFKSIRLEHYLWIVLIAALFVLPVCGRANEPRNGDEKTCLARAGNSQAAIRLCAPAGPRFALVVGLEDYAAYHPYKGQTWSRLEIAGRDADAMAQRLVASGFALVGEKVQRNLTRATFSDALKSLARLGDGRNATLLVYVSGHGFTHRSQTLVAPVEAPRPIPGVPTVSDRYISVTDIERLLGPSAPRLQIILFDACRDALPSIDPVRGEQDVLGPQTVLGLAAAPGTTVDVREGAAISTYTRALLDGLSNPSVDLTLSRLFFDVSSAVIDLTAGEQKPVFRYGSPQLHSMLSAGAVFAGTPDPFASEADVAFDLVVQRQILHTFDYALACDWAEKPERKNPIPIEARQFYGLVLFAVRDDAERSVRCNQISDEVDKDAKLPAPLTERLDDYMARNVNGLLMQTAQSGNGHANWIVFLFSLGNTRELLFTRDMLNSYLPSERRTALEFLYRAADGGEPMAQLLLGQQSMPAESESSYFAVLPGPISETYENGRAYLERALDAGIGDAGLILAYNARRNLQDLDTHPELYRSYVEKALTKRMLIFPPPYVLTARFLLADDYLNGNTGPKNAAKGLAMMLEVADTPSPGEGADMSGAGLAAWRLAFLWMTQTAPLPEGMTRDQAVYTYTQRAMKLGVKEALEFGSEAYAEGRYGFPKDAIHAADAKREAATTETISRYSITPQRPKPGKRQ